MRKLFCMALCLIFVFSMTCVSFASEASDLTSIRTAKPLPNSLEYKLDITPRYIVDATLTNEKNKTWTYYKQPLKVRFNTSVHQDFPGVTGTIAGRSYAYCGTTCDSITMLDEFSLTGLNVEISGGGFTPNLTNTKITKTSSTNNQNQFLCEFSDIKYSGFNFTIKETTSATFVKGKRSIDITCSDSEPL